MEELIKILFIAVICLALYGIYLGITKKGIFYLNQKDMFISFSGWISVIIGGFFALYLEWHFMMYIGLIIAAIVAVYSTYLAFVFNGRDFAVAIPIGIAKLLLGLVYVINVAKFIDPDRKNASQRRESRINAMIVIALLTPLLGILINGEEVCEINGWDYSEMLELI